MTLLQLAEGCLHPLEGSKGSGFTHAGLFQHVAPVKNHPHIRQEWDRPHAPIPNQRGSLPGGRQENFLAADVFDLGWLIGPQRIHGNKTPDHLPKVLDGNRVLAGDGEVNS